MDNKVKVKIIKLDSTPICKPTNRSGEAEVRFDFTTMSKTKQNRIIKSNDLKFFSTID